jgi:hypothetical protein
MLAVKQNIFFFLTNLFSSLECHLSRIFFSFMRSSRFHLLFSVFIAATSILLIIAFRYYQKDSETIILTEDIKVLSGALKDAT